jgi:hypothetical protein
VVTRAVGWVVDVPLVEGRRTKYVLGIKTTARNVTPKYEASDPESSYDIPGAILATPVLA